MNEYHIWNINATSRYEGWIYTQDGDSPEDALRRYEANDTQGLIKHGGVYVVANSGGGHQEVGVFRVSKAEPVEDRDFVRDLVIA
jgi:hypothetical protein